jgi:hypothetical protein
MVPPMIAPVLYVLETPTLVCELVGAGDAVLEGASNVFDDVVGVFDEGDTGGMTDALDDELVDPVSVDVVDAAVGDRYRCSVVATGPQPKFS